MPGRFLSAMGFLDLRACTTRATSISRTQNGTPKSKTPELLLARAVYMDISLTMSYFHTGTRTIIGAEAFHFPVRDGKEWDHLAMVIRLNWLPARSHERAGQIMEFESVL